MAQGVDQATYLPIGRTQTFNSSDYGAYSWIEFTNVPGPSHNVTWAWITPAGNVFFTSDVTIPSPFSGSWSTYYVYDYIYIRDSEALLLPGAWAVDVYSDGVIVLTQNFNVESVYLSPQDVRNAYDVSPLIASGYTGAGVTVAVESPAIPPSFYSDLQGFDKTYGLPGVNVTVVTPYGTQGTTTYSSANGPIETITDVELVHAMAPGARILLVLTGNHPNLDGFSYVIDNKAAQVATTSWYDVYSGGSASSYADSYNTEYSKSVAENITLISSSGDYGSNNTVPWTSNGPYTGTFWTSYLPDAYMMPAYSPYVTSVGGTQLNLNGSLYLSEIGWNQSGGGPSNLFGQQSWQRGPGVPSNANRDMPDLALDASCATPYLGYFNGSISLFCGTSGAAPTFAGIVADIVQAAGHPVGFLNPSLYSLAASNSTAFNQITSGCSLVKKTPNSPTQTGYCPHQGWNYVTGLGTPNAVALLHYLAPQVRIAGVSFTNKEAGLGFLSSGIPMITQGSLLFVVAFVRRPGRALASALVRYYSLRMTFHTG